MIDKFEGVAHTMTDLGLPLLHEALAHLECTTVNKHVEGDHTIFVGRVERISVPEIQKITGWTAATIKVRAFRARQKLRKQIGGLL